MHKQHPQPTSPPRLGLVGALTLIPAVGLLAVVLTATLQPRTRSYSLGMKDSSNIRGIIQANILWAQNNPDDPETSPADEPSDDRSP